MVERAYSPRVAILGAQTFSQEGHSVDDRTMKISDEPSNTVTKQIERMEVSYTVEVKKLSIELIGFGFWITQQVQARVNSAER